MAKSLAHMLPPRFKAGDVIDRLKVIQHIGFWGKGRQKRQHQYLCECDCGAQLEQTQDSLVRQSRGTMRQFGKMCDSCRKSMRTKSAGFLNPIESSAAQGLRWVMKNWPVPD